MDKHTFIGKRKVGSTDICDFTDYQGIGHDPLYKRYESVNSIVKRVISPAYAHFLAVPSYSQDEDVVNWYIDEWTDIPEALVSLSGEKRQKYERIKDSTIAHFRQAIETLSGEELQVMACALRYIDDNFIFCADDKVYLLAWGMTPDTRKHIAIGELIHAAPGTTKYKITFDPGQHGEIPASYQQEITLPEGTEISPNDLPAVEVFNGYTLRAWSPEPIGMKVEGDMTFTAVYEKNPVLPPPITPPEPPAPKMITCRFMAPQGTAIQGNSVVTKPMGSMLVPGDIPPVVPPKGYEFKGWNINPLNLALNRDMVFQAVVEKKSGFPAWLKWVLIGLLGLLLLLLAAWLLSKCTRCQRAVNGVVPIGSIIGADGDSIDDNGRAKPILLDDGKLPEESAIVAPVFDEDGQPAPIVRDPGVPAVFGNRLFLFLENENDNIDSFAADFKKAYPGSQYSIIGFDRDVKSLVIQIPENERENIRKTIQQKIPNHQFIVFDEEVYELKSIQSTGSESDPGWHLKAVKAQEGWNITRGSPEVKIAVVDDGIQASHPIFKDRIVDPYNVFTQNNHLSTGVGHGTHTAGLAAGSLEYLNKGAAGIAPDCKLMPIQVIDNSSCPLSALVSGIMYAIHKGADVVNISIGPSFPGLNVLPPSTQAEIGRSQFKNVEMLWQRVCKLAASKNVILVFAAGNDDIYSSIPPENRTQVAITVGAVDKRRYPTVFTNYGPCTDISAPGSAIYSSFPTSSFRDSDGTSMAAPIVTGAIALMKSLKKDLTVEQARNVLYRTGVDVYGYMPPMLQVNLALEAVKKGDFSAPPTRQMTPVPEAARGEYNGTPPESWNNGGVVAVDDPGNPSVVVAPGEVGYPVGTVVVTDPVAGVVPGSGTTPTPTVGTTPGTGTTPGSNPGTTPGTDNNVAPRPSTDSNYDEIRRLIEHHKKQIRELEKQLPENKK